MFEKDGIRNLEKICTKEGGNFYTIIRGNVYCSLAWTRKINCKYLSDEPDCNGLYTCTYKPYLKIRDEIINDVEYMVLM